MRKNSLILTLTACLLAGCSTYDAVRLPADLALLFFTDVYEDDNGRSKGMDDDHHRLWDPQTSRCVYLEENARSLQGSLDRLFDEVEAGEEYVELPTGEKYPVDPDVSPVSYENSPTAVCEAPEAD